MAETFVLWAASVIAGSGTVVMSASTLAILTAVTNVVILTAVNYGLNRALTKNPTAPSLEALNNTTTIRSATAPRQLIYGEIRVGGVLVYAETSGTGNEYLNLVIALAGHEVEAIGDIYFNDEVVPLSGSSATGAYAGVASVFKHLGTSTQTVDTDLQAAVTATNWSNDHRLRGIAYIYVKLKFDQNKFPGGIPNISAIVKGRKVLDTRTSTTAWSANWALCVRDYLTLSGLGLGASAAEINVAECDAAANICDEDVTLNPSGTEKRYTVNGLIDLSETPGGILQKLTSAGAGLILYIGGKWIIRAGAYQTPALTFDENDFRGPLSVQTKSSRRETFNGVKGIYVSAGNQYQPADFPQIIGKLAATAIVEDLQYVITVVGNTDFTAIGASANTVGVLFTATGAGTGTGYVDHWLGEDGGERIWRDVELPFTTSSPTAQRLAKIELERGRQQITVSAPMKLTAMQCQAGDVINLTNTRMGWTAKPFEVVEFSFTVEDQGGSPALGVDLVLRETASAVWDWNNGEEAVVDAAPNTTLYDPRVIETPTGLTLLADSTTQILQSDGTFVPAIKITWTAPTGAYILNGGFAEIGYKLSTATDYILWNTVDGNIVEERLTDVKAGSQYHVRIRFMNQLGVYGAYCAAVLSAAVAGDATIPNGPSGGSFVAGDTAAEPRPPTRLENGVQLYACIVKWTPSTSPDVSFYDFQGSSINSDAAADIVYDVNGPEFRVVGRYASQLHYYRPDANTRYLRVRSYDRSFNRSAWVVLGELSSYMKLPAGDLSEQNKSAVSITGGSIDVATLKKGGTSVVTEARTVNGHALSSNVTVTSADIGIYAGAGSVTLTGGALTEAAHFNITSGGFSAKPSFGIIQCMSNYGVLGYFDESDAGNSATNAELFFFRWDGTNLAAGSYSFNYFFLE